MSGQNFFDIRARLTARPVKPVATPAAGGPMTVGQVTRLIDKVVRAGIPASLAVRGEVSNYSHNVQSGHAYFTLKDQTDKLHCVMFKDHFDRLKFSPSNGLELVATGNVQVFGPQGRHQLYATDLQPVGHGALELAFKQLCQKLQAEGLFDESGRKPLPRFPQRIAVITSRQTAALKDILRSLAAAPGLKLFLFHVPVQGEGCGAKIADAVKCLNRGHGAIGGIDLILLGRGGGSYEDLWGFNDESLARAIRASKIPVITGIGHDVDVSIADLAADYHAHTPTQAATIAVQHWVKAVDLLNGMAGRIARGMREKIGSAGHQLTGIERHELFRKPTEIIDDRRVLIDDREQGLAMAIDRLMQRARSRVQTGGDRLARFTPVEQIHRHRTRLDRLLAGMSAGLNRKIRLSHDRMSRLESRLSARHPAGLVRLQLDRLDSRQTRLDRGLADSLRRRSDRLDALSSQLEALNPKRILERGYSITTLKKTGGLVRSAGTVKEPDRLVTRFADGEVESVVRDPGRPGLFE